MDEVDKKNIINVLEYHALYYMKECIARVDFGVLQVASLLERTEGLGIFLHANIHTALKRHHMAICITQARCSEETANLSQYQQQKAYFTEYRGNLCMFVFPQLQSCPS